MKGDKAKTNIVVVEDTVITSHMIDYTGVIFNERWIAIRPVGRNYENRMLWEFECLNCHKKVIRTACNIKGCTCDCIANRHLKYTMSFYDWCIENNHRDWIGLWDYELNKYDIHMIGYSSDCYCWFKCNNHNNNHTSEKYRLSNLVQKRQKGIFCNQCNSFAQWGIDNLGEDFLEKYWDYEKNDINPWEISRGSEKKIWIKCPNKKHDSHKMITNNCQKRLCSCPECVNEEKVSRLHLKCIEYLKDLGLSFNTEFECNIVPTNKDSMNKMPYDIEVVEYKLIIEIMGIQHYEKFKPGHPWLKGLSPEEYLRKRIDYDKYKKDYALYNGYNYLAISYKSEKYDEYKVLINNKLKEIKS